MPRDSCSSTRLGTHRYSGDDSQSGRSTQANTYSDRTRSQGASSDPGEGSLEVRLTANADPMTDRWQELAPMNTALGAVGVAEVGGKITFSVAVLAIHFPSTSTKSMTQ
jgi:hypothetical protein